MIRSTTASVALLLGLFFESAIAQDGIPVEDRSDQNSPSSNSAVSRPSSAPAAVAPSSVANTPAPVTASASSNAALGELLMMLDQLQEEVGMLRGQVEQQQHQLKKMQTDQRDRYRDLDRRLSLLNQQAYAAPATTSPLTPLAGATAAGSSSTPAITSASTTALASAPSTAGSVNEVSDSQAFKDAFALVRKSQFDQALQAFEQFLVTYPDSALTANVLYWTGEVHRAQSNPDLEKASFAYQQVIERYPNNAKVADAYYKLGLSQQGLEQTEKAKATMNKLIELFPDQVTAELARDFLKQQR